MPTGAAGLPMTDDDRGEHEPPRAQVLRASLRPRRPVPSSLSRVMLLVARSSARESTLVVARTGQSCADTAGRRRGAPQVHAVEESTLVSARWADPHATYQARAPEPADC